jgi:hypothetical protein
MNHSIPPLANLAERIASIRSELYGDGQAGLEAIAHELAIPPQTWANYESGVTIPATFIIQFIVLTNANPAWLMDGTGIRYLPAVRGERPIVRKGFSSQ